MKDIMIYIGVSARDIIQYEYLINSIKTFNIDNIPVLTCVKDEDFDIFKEKFKNYTFITFLKDSDVYETSVQNPWYKQQLIKMNLWKLKISKIFIQIDADCFFIKNFYIKDFMATESIPYTIIHENKELKEFFAKHNLHNNKRDYNGDYTVLQGFSDNSKKIRDLFDTTYISAEYDFGHPPCIWSNKVWETLYFEYINPYKLSYESLIDYANSEQQWYGETLLKFNIFPIYPKENMFKTFHYKQNFDDYFKDEDAKNIKYNYHGICLQSNWANPNSIEFSTLYNKFFDLNKLPKFFNGQFNEDEWIVNNCNLPKNGIFVDVGADQPIFGSNTYYFEKILNWSGFCVDADYRTIPTLKKYRKNVENFAISNREGEIGFNFNNVAGISAVNDLSKDKVKTLKLDSLLEKYEYNSIDLLSIDVEGHELIVCEGINWGKYKPKIVIIEFISPVGGNIKNKLLNFFENLGCYKLINTTTANLIFTYYETL